MNVYKEIEKYLNDKIKLYEKSIIKEISIVLDINEEFIKDKFSHFFPVYVVKKDSLKLSLDMDFDKLSVEDLRLIEFFLDLMEDEDKVYLGGLDNNSKIASLLLKETKKKYIMPYKNNLNYYFESNIFQGSKSSDLDYIISFLLFLGVSKINDIYNFSTFNVDFKDSIFIYSDLITSLSIMIVSNLHKNGIYLFDNKYLSQKCDTMESSIEDYFRKFYILFKDLIPCFITSYDKFIDYVGYENFVMFAQKIKNDDIEDINDLLNLMYKHYLEYDNNLIIDMETISNSIKKYKKNRS